MISERKIRKVLRKALRNPYYREAYRNAPSDRSRRYWQLTFCVSAAARKETDGEFGAECGEELSDVKRKLTLEDWEHLYEYSGTPKFRAVCRRKIDELQELVVTEKPVSMIVWTYSVKGMAELSREWGESSQVLEGDLSETYIMPKRGVTDDDVSVVSDLSHVEEAWYDYYNYEPATKVSRPGRGLRRKAMA